MSKKPIVKGNDIILSPPKNLVKLSTEEMSTEVEAEVRFIGNLVEDYKIGDKVLFNKNKAIQIEYFKPEEYWKIHEKYITCGIEG